MSIPSEYQSLSHTRTLACALAHVHTVACRICATALVIVVFIADVRLTDRSLQILSICGASAPGSRRVSLPTHGCLLFNVVYAHVLGYFGNGARVLLCVQVPQSKWTLLEPLKVLLSLYTPWIYQFHFLGVSAMGLAFALPSMVFGSSLNRRGSCSVP